MLTWLISSTSENGVRESSVKLVKYMIVVSERSCKTQHIQSRNAGLHVLSTIHLHRLIVVVQSKFAAPLRL